ncbi:MAG: transposase [Eggerthellaceae bacterium]|nr:transposase [Eggerthellaceae bacterium]
MSKFGRIPSEFDIYHVTARGVGKMDIFEDDGDRRRFGKLMRKQLSECDVELYAWCFMQNHVHLLLHCPLDALSRFMGCLLSEYASYYNWRYERVGHLFQGRFDSKPIKDERQLLATVRYVHQNPKDLGVTDWGAYPWSSYREYIGASFVTKTEVILRLFNGLEGFVLMHKTIETNRGLEPGPQGVKRFRSEDEAIARAKEVVGCKELSEIAAAGKGERDAMLVLLKNDGFSVRQIERMTGISKSVIQRAR